MNFIAKLNKRDSPYMISDEIFTMTAGKCARYLDHDNANRKTIEIFTEPLRQGQKVLNYTIEQRKDAEWKLFLKIFSQSEKVYVNYECQGDIVEADDINDLQQKIIRGDAELEVEKRITKEHRDDMDNPHGIKEAIEAARRQAATALTASEERLDGNLDAHKARTDNPHSVTKVQVGLGKLDDVKQASKTEFEAHNGDNTRHITLAERQTWNDKYTKDEVDNKFSTFPKATQSVDGLLSKEDKVALDDMETKKHGHSNKTVLDGITTALIEAWNTINNKVDKITGKGLSANDYTAAEKDKLAGIAAGANKYTHPAYTPRAAGFHKITVDATGHISVAAAVSKTDITALGIPAQDTVYSHPSSHPASMISGLPTYLPTSGVTWNQLKGV